MLKFGYPPKFIAVVKVFHDNITNRVVVRCGETDKLNVGIAPVTFNVCLAQKLFIFDITHGLVL